MAFASPQRQEFMARLVKNLIGDNGVDSAVLTVLEGQVAVLEDRLTFRQRAIYAAHHSDSRTQFMAT